jgi:hypothetical protein
MTYKDHDINCDNYPWLVRVLTMKSRMTLACGAKLAS